MAFLSLSFAVLCGALSSQIAHGQYIETERVEEYHKRGYSWPPQEYVPNTPGWSAIMKKRQRQMAGIDDWLGRYNGYLQFTSQSIIAPNFTEHGWGLTRAPQDIVDKLKASLHNGLPTAKEEEDKVGRTVIEGSANATNWQRPLFIPQVALNDEVLQRLKPMHEAWAGIPLVGEVAYGLRVYRNESMLHMHVDRPRTHVISCILHVDHDDDPDSEPWPIYIEDFQGNLNEVKLESGDMLFYESSKCMHGRPKPFKGKWYSSIFVHFYPAEEWNQNQRTEEAHFAIPPEWDQVTKDPSVPQVVMAATAMTEPECEHMWCDLNKAIKWSGPAKQGVVISAGDRDVYDRIKEEL